jgi:hypothetical protein
MGKSGGPYLEWLTGHYAESAANTVTEHQIGLPTSKNENLAMLIHSVIFDRLDCDRIDETRTSCAAWLSLRNGYTGGFDAEGADYQNIAWAKRELSCGEEQGTLSEYVVDYGDRAYVERKFDPPVLVAQDFAYVGVRGENNGPARDIVCRIGYTLEKVSSQDFISALVKS